MNDDLFKKKYTNHTLFSFQTDLYDVTHLLAIPMMRYGVCKWSSSFEQFLRQRKITYVSFLVVPDMISIILLASFSVQYGFLLGMVSCAFIYVVQHGYLSAQKLFRLRQRRSQNAYESAVLQMRAGMEHVRAFGQERQTMHTIRELLYRQQEWDYSIARALSRVELLGQLWYGFLAVAIVTLALAFPSQTSSSILSVTLLVLASPSTFSLGFMDSMEDIDQRLDTIARIQQLCEETPQEQDDRDIWVASGEWPSAGNIGFTQATVITE